MKNEHLLRAEIHLFPSCSAAKGTGGNPPLSQTTLRHDTMPTKSAFASALADLKPGRSAWDRGVHAYAVELVESLTESDDLSNETLLRKALLNGADDWQQYSEGGCALVYDADIAERLCSPV